MTDFQKFLFDGLTIEDEAIPGYIGIKTLVNAAEDKVIINVAADMVFKTKYGFALKTSPGKVVFLKPWQVNGYEAAMYEGDQSVLVCLNKKYFTVKSFGHHTDGEEAANEWGYYVKVAKAQEQHLKETEFGAYGWDKNYYN